MLLLSAIVDITDNFNETALHKSALYGHTEILQYLIEKHANIEAVSENGNSPLHCACVNGHADCIQGTHR
jgi:ankyrin repeat protein